MKTLELITTLWRHIGLDQRKQLVNLLFVMILASFSEVISIGAVMPFLGVLIAPEKLLNYPFLQKLVVTMGFAEGNQLIFTVTLLFILAALFSGGMRLTLLWLQTQIGFKIGADFSIQIYEKTLYQPYSVHTSRNSSEVITGISSKTNFVIYNSLLPLLLISSCTLILIAILVVIVYIDPYVALITFGGFGFAYGLIMLMIRKRLLKNSQRISYESNKVIKALQEGLGGIRDVLIDGTQSTYCKIYRQADLVLRKSQASNQIIGSAPRYLVESLGISLIAFLAYVLSMGKDGVLVAIPMLGALAIAAQRLLPVLQQLYSSWSTFMGNRASLEDVLELLDQQLPEYKHNSIPVAFQKCIKFDQVFFRYKADSAWILEDINLEIPKGSKTGIIGTTGSGKSTLTDILMGLLNPTKGKLLVDGCEITIQNCRSWQSHIAHVPQTIFLADTTVAENIAFGIPIQDIDFVKVEMAARQAQISETIESWPDKYKTFVGERGVRLSGGQRQRIGIARALYKQADIIILDEATSALDTATEQSVMSTFDSIDKGITLVIVAHRLSTLKGCDRIFDLTISKN